MRVKVVVEFRYFSYMVLLFLMLFFLGLFTYGSISPVEKPNLPSSSNPLDFLRNVFSQIELMFVKLMMFNAFTGIAPSPYDLLLNALFGFVAWFLMFFLLYFMISFIIKLIKPFG